jgi:hypothetical protein
MDFFLFNNRLGSLRKSRVRLLAAQRLSMRLFWFLVQVVWDALISHSGDVRKKNRLYPHAALRSRTRLSASSLFAQINFSDDS